MSDVLLYRFRVAVLTLAAIFSGGALCSAQIPAFPGAEGFGAYATGGRGGDVYTVVNLNSSGPGSLRYGVENAPASGRTIVFAVSGYIPINYNSDTGNNTLRLVQNKITIAGQTAPGDGIGLKDGRILVTGDDEVIRHIRVRHGKYGSAGDCVNVDSSANNTMLDHMSLMFSTDENISFFNSSVNNFTMQYCTSSWGMERHNAGGLWDLDHGSCHHTLWAHHRTRNPKARPNGLLEWINNVTYHWRSEGFIMGDSQSNVDWYANVIGCYYISIADFGFGLDSTPLSKARIASNGQPNFHLYLADTLIDADGDGVLNGTDQGYDIVSGVPYPTGGTTPGTLSYDQSATPFTGSPESVTVDDPLTAYKKVMSSSGALRLNTTYAGLLRDELDDLLIESIENQESILIAKDTPVTTHPDEPPSNGEQHLADEYGISNSGFGTLNSTAYPTDTDGDGMPDFWENTVGWNATVQDHNTVMAHSGGYVTGLTFFPASTPAGYTRLEEYLHFKAIPHASIPVNGLLEVNLGKYTRGFTASPVFSISNATNGIAVMQPDGYTVSFTPTAGFSGRCRFDFTVTDSAGSTWTQTMAVLASGQLVLPDAPSGLNAAAVSSYQIDLGWVDNSNNESGFKIERSANNVTFSEIDIVAANTTSYSDAALAPATPYYYRVRSFNGVGNSSYSAVASDTTFAGAPSPPSGLSATPGNTQISLSWSASSGAVSYIIKRAESIIGPYDSIATNATTSYVDSGLINGTVYFYVVSALNASGESDDSSPTSATPTLAIQINSGGPAVSPFAADTYYTAGSAYTNAGSIDTSGVLDPAPSAVYQTERHGNFSYVIPGMEPGEHYLVRLHFADIYHTASGLRTFNVYINGTQVLTEYDIVAETGARYKATVHEFTVPADSGGQIEIEYETVLDNSLSSGIEVLTTRQPLEIVAHPADQSVLTGSTAVFTVLTTGDPSPSRIWMKNGTELTGETNQTLVVSNAQLADQGMYSVAVYNGLGCVISSDAALTVGSVSSVPTGLFATPGNNQIGLNWYEATDATSYNVKRATSESGPYQIIATIPDTSHTDLSAQNGTTYYYVVSANSPGESAHSSEVSVTPEAIHGGTAIQVEDVSTTSGGNVLLESNNAGFHVSAFANFPTTGGYVQFNNVDGGTGGTAVLDIRFALGNTARTGSMIVNGTASAITFPQTASWTTWANMSVDVMLNAGAVNTIRFESTGQDLANIDEITVAPTVVNIPESGPVIESAYTNGMFYMNWPVDNTGWILQRSTNLLNSTNWVSVPNSEATNSRAVPVNILPWNEVFYRLMEP